MNLKLILGNLLKKIGLVSFALKFVRKFGYLTHYIDEHSSGIDLINDINQNNKIQNIKTVFDIGASVGSMTNKFLKVFPNSKIHAFEPYSVSYEKLENSFKNLKRVKPNKLALSNESGQLKMYIKKDSGYNSLSEISNKPDKNNDETFELVKISTIDTYCQENGIAEIDFLKIDTEGLEIKVLEGAVKMLNSGKIKYIFAECTFEKEYEQNTYFELLYSYLKQYNFKLRALYDQSTFGNTNYISCVNALFLLQKIK